MELNQASVFAFYLAYLKKRKIFTFHDHDHNLPNHIKRKILESFLNIKSFEFDAFIFGSNSAE